jgi:hypothetical protein
MITCLHRYNADETAFAAGEHCQHVEAAQRLPAYRS